MTPIIKNNKRLTYTQIVALGFLLIILAGTLLLMLPISSKGQPPCFTDAFFTATSATCVTGLAVFDTVTQWSIFGQIVILLMIQTGGLGFLTIMALFSFLLGRRIGLRSRELLKESINNLQIGGIVKLIRRVLLGTLIIEALGAVILSIRFIPVFGWGTGIYYGVFHSISAFCNAGFDLMGVTGEYSSFASFYSDSVVLITLTLLILVGGIGFFVWDDVCKNKLHFTRYRLHTKLALLMTLILSLGGAALMLAFEYDNTLKDMGLYDKIIVSLFSAVTPRTAGFNVLDGAALTPASKLLTMAFMVIGGCPGSTAGGIKTITVAVLVIAAWASIRNMKDGNAFRRRLPESAVRRAGTVVAVYSALALTGALIVCFACRELPLSDIVFETLSACSTVGMTTGITRALSPVARWAVIMMMYCGRVGSVSFIMAFAQNKAPAPIKLPEEDISIG